MARNEFCSVLNGTAARAWLFCFKDLRRIAKYSITTPLFRNWCFFMALYPAQNSSFFIFGIFCNSTFMFYNWSFDIHFWLFTLQSNIHVSQCDIGVSQSNIHVFQLNIHVSQSNIHVSQSNIRALFSAYPYLLLVNQCIAPCRVKIHAWGWAW